MLGSGALAEHKTGRVLALTEPAWRCCESHRSTWALEPECLSFKPPALHLGCVTLSMHFRKMGIIRAACKGF